MYIGIHLSCFLELFLHCQTHKLYIKILIYSTQACDLWHNNLSVTVCYLRGNFLPNIFSVCGRYSAEKDGDAWNGMIFSRSEWPQRNNQNSRKFWHMYCLICKFNFLEISVFYFWLFMDFVHIYKYWESGGKYGELWYIGKSHILISPLIAWNWLYKEDFYWRNFSSQISICLNHSRMFQLRSQKSSPSWSMFEVLRKGLNWEVRRKSFSSRVKERRSQPACC